MKPIKAKTLIPKTAELTGFSEEICTKLINLYYKDLREKLSDMTEPVMMSEKMGNFYLKEKKMTKREQSYIRMKEAIEKWKDGPRRQAMLREIEMQLERITRNKEKLQQTRDKRTQVIQKQIELRESKTRLEEQKEDSTGLVE